MSVTGRIRSIRTLPSTGSTADSVAAHPVDLEDPEALAIEGQGPDLIVASAEAPAAGIAGRVEDLDPAHPPAGGVEPAAIGAERQAADDSGTR